MMPLRVSQYNLIKVFFIVYQFYMTWNHQNNSFFVKCYLFMNQIYRKFELDSYTSHWLCLKDFKHCLYNNDNDKGLSMFSGNTIGKSIFITRWNNLPCLPWNWISPPIKYIQYTWWQGLLIRKYPHISEKYNPNKPFGHSEN